MKNLEMYGVQEMNAKEMKKTDGGGFWSFAAGAFAGALLVELITDGVSQCWADLKEGFNESYDG